MVTKQRGLGRGLDALFEDEEPNFSHSAPGAASPAADASRRLVNIGQLEANPDQPRLQFDEDALKALAVSIKKHGVLQPILVRPNRMEPGRYEIIAGERRWRAAQRAQLHEVPIIIRELDDNETFQIALIENLQREDLNAMEEARGYQRLVDDFGHSHESVGDVIGKSRSHVANMIRLLQLPPSVQSMVTNGQLTAGHARALLNSENPALLAQEIVSKGLSVRQAEKLAKKHAGANYKAHKSGKNAPKDPDHLAVEKMISEATGMNATVTLTGEKKGVLTVEFADLDQFDLLLARLTLRGQ